MPRKLRGPDGLNQSEHRYARHRALGLSQRQAYRMAFKTRGTDASVDTQAARLENRVEIKSRITEILRTLSVADLDSPAQTYNDLLDMMTDARKSKNHTAAASFQRLRMDAQGMLKSGAHGQSDRLFSDENLVERLAGANLELRKQLAQLLGADDFAKPAPAVTPAVTPAPVEETKH